MNKKNILPHPGKPVIRGISGKLPSHLAELSEEALGGAGVDALYRPLFLRWCGCIYRPLFLRWCGCIYRPLFLR